MRGSASRSTCGSRSAPGTASPATTGGAAAASTGPAASAVPSAASACRSAAKQRPQRKQRGRRIFAVLWLLCGFRFYHERVSYRRLLVALAIAVLLPVLAAAALAQVSQQDPDWRPRISVGRG